MNCRANFSVNVKDVISCLFVVSFLIFSVHINGQVDLPESNETGSFMRFDDKNLTSESFLSNLENQETIEFIDAQGAVCKFEIEKHNLISGKLKHQFPFHHSFNIKNINTQAVAGKMVISPKGVYAIYHSANGKTMISPSKNEGIYKIENDWDIDPATLEKVLCGVKGHAEAHGLNTKSAIPYTNGDILRSYEMAIIVTGEYYEANGDNDNEVMSWVMMNVEGLNLVFEKDLSATFVLGNRVLLHRNKDTDPFTPDPDPDVDNRIALSVQELDATYSPGEYDIGHVLHNSTFQSGFSGGGIAGLYALCSSGKNRGWSGSFSNQTTGFISLFAHEVGHMFGAAHTFNGTGGSCTDNISDYNSVEIGSGVTIMSYAGACDSEYNIPRPLPRESYLYFNVSNLYQMIDHMDATDCHDIVSHQNAIPSVNVNPCGVVEYNIPINTPFTLRGEGMDADSDDQLSYCWEQFDEDGPGTPTQGFLGDDAANSSTAPQLRSYPPMASGFRQFPSTTNLLNFNNPFEVLSMVPRELNMRLTVRDNKIEGGAVAVEELLINVVAGGPFVVTAPNSSDEFDSGTSIPVNWSTNGTEELCDLVTISLSVDDGNSFDIILAENVPYDQETMDIEIPVGLEDLTFARIKVECSDNECFTIFNITDNFSINASCVSDDHAICGVDSFNLTAIVGSSALLLDFTPEFINYIPSYPVAVDFASPREATSRRDLDGNCQLIGTTGSPPLNLPVGDFEFNVDLSGQYTFSTDITIFKIMNIHLADTYDANDPCASHVATNASESSNSPGTTSTAAGQSFNANLEACTNYIFKAAIFNEEIAMNVSVNGPGDFIEFTTTQNDLQYTFIAISQSNNQIVAVSSDADFRSLVIGSYDVYGVQYEDTSDPDSWIGSQTNSLLYECIGLSKNHLDLEVTPNLDMIEICGNGIDDDLDGDTDCDDTDLQSECCCLEPLALDPIDDVLACRGNDVSFTVNPNFTDVVWTDLVNDVELTTETTVFLNMAGVYSVAVIDSCGNMMADTFGLEFLDPISSDTLLFLCLGDQIIINGETYEEGGSYQQDLTSAAGCDSTLNISINEISPSETNINQEICFGDEIIINGEIYSQAGMYQQILTSVEGCDSTLNIMVDVVSVVSEEMFFKLCPNSEIEVNGEVYDIGGSYQQDFQSSNGCDSLLIINVTEVDSTSGNLQAEICPESEIEINGEIYSAAGTYQQNLTGSNGCDSTLNIVIEELSISEETIDQSLCLGEEIVINGETYNDNGMYQQILSGSNGCDSILNINIEILINPEGQLNEFICSGDEIQINNEVYNTSGSYQQLLIGENGCDSTLNIQIDFLLVDEGQLSATFCLGSEIEINGEVYDMAGSYQQTLTAQNTCDSILNIEITELAINEGNLNETICTFGEIEINGEVYNMEGTYQQTLDGSNGCDSILNISIVELPITEGIFEADICEGSQIEINGEVYTLAGMYSQTLSNANDCDSILNITINEVMVIEEDLNASFCTDGEVEINGETYDTPGTYQQFLTANSGCDSILNINIIEVEPVEESISEEICVDSDIEINGETYNAAGTYTQQLTAASGCDSILNITIAEVVAIEESLAQAICAGTEITINGESYNAAGEYQQDFMASNGCDSILNISIAVLDTIVGNILDSFCEGAEIEINGETYNSAGTYQQNLSSTAGCDSLLIIDLTTIPTSEELVMFNICEGDSLIINDEVFNASGNYQQLLLASNGCDSILNIAIELDQTYLITQSFTILPGDVITVNGQDYTMEGNYSQDLQTVDGCDSIISIIIAEIKSVVYFDLDECLAWTTGPNRDYSEFTPNYPNTLPCGEIESSVLYRENPMTNLHSCTPGRNGSNALCVGSLDDCSYDKNSDKPLVFEMDITPEVGSNITLHALEFYQKGPENFEWINGDTGVNNYPTLYGIRVLLNGNEVFFSDNLPTTTDWNLENISFDSIHVSTKSNVRIEMMGYCLIDNGGLVNAWDVEDINVMASCEGANGNRRVAGKILTHTDKLVQNVEVKINGPEFYNSNMTNEFGKYNFENINALYDHQIFAFKNDDCLNGVSTLDLVLIQKHILGLKEFDEAYKFVAADINKSGEVSTIDLIELRKLILNIYSEFPQNTSWRFCDVDDEMTMANPWNINENIIIGAGNASPEIKKDLMGIKIGDVNGDVIGTRSNEKLSLIYSAKNSSEHIKTIEFTAKNFNEIHGLQLILSAKDAKINNLISGALDLSETNVNLQDDKVFISWHNSQALNLDQGEVLFSLVVNADTGFKIELASNQALNNEAYTGETLQIMNAELKERNDNTISSKFEISKVSPNPFSDKLTINYECTSTQTIDIQLYDIAGIRVMEKSFVAKEGASNYVLDTDNLPSNNFYILKLVSNNDLFAQKLLHIK